MHFERIVLVVLDSVGIGAMPDAHRYGDPPGADTLGNIARLRPLRLPNLRRLGLANIRPLHGIEPASQPQGAFGRCTLASPGKDTTTGHWEIAGIHLDRPFPLFPGGFPHPLLREWEHRIGRASLGNVAASGTEIINRLGAEHVSTGRPIVYTSADSVFQVAAHEDITALPELYRMCEIARELLHGPFKVGRVIARPFEGEPGAFRRTSQRKDFAVPPPAGMLLDQLAAAGVSVCGIGKIGDIFLGRGISTSHKTASNAEGMSLTLEQLRSGTHPFVFVNLVDFDQLYGHRNDAGGYAAALEQVDEWLPSAEAALAGGDLLLFTADHGCDPTVPGTDHTREYVPLLAAGPRCPPGLDWGTRASLSDIGQTIANNFGQRLAHGTGLFA